MDLIEFAFGALTGVAGNTAYDGMKLILGNTFSKLEAFAKDDDKDRFELVLQTAIDSNVEIKKQLE